MLYGITEHTCVSCLNPFDESDMVRVTQANRASHNNEGAAFICKHCAEAKAKRNARNKAERGAEMVCDLDYRITIPCKYTVQTRAEFCKAGWLACDGALKSPKLHNFKWQRKLETLDSLIERGEVELTGKMSVSVLRGSDVLECEKVEYLGKAEFLTFVRELVEHHKAEIYLRLYGKTFGYKLRK